MDPLAGSTWSAPDTIEGFKRSPPNAALMRLAERELRRAPNGRILDIGCGAGRNTIPLAQLGWTALGIDLSWPMLRAAAERAQDNGAGRTGLALAPMSELPARDGTFDLVVAHGIWNLARSAAEFRRALGEAARVAKPGAALFVFTFSRHTLPPQVEPVPGESFVFTQFSGEPQCFLSEAQLVAELGRAGFAPERGAPIQEYNRPQPGMRCSGAAPVIYEGTFRRGKEGDGVAAPLAIRSASGEGKASLARGGSGC